MIGVSASEFGAYTNGVPDPTRVARYMAKAGGAEADIMVVETLDRDAGCFEVGSDRNGKRAGAFYWDENNVRHPNFHDHLAWAKVIRTVTGKPLLWWPLPLGVPASASAPSSAPVQATRRPRAPTADSSKERPHGVPRAAAAA